MSIELFWTLIGAAIALGAVGAVAVGWYAVGKAKVQRNVAVVSRGPTQPKIAYIGIPYMGTDHIEDTGATRRVYFYLLLDLEDGTRAWHYFGTTPTAFPPFTQDPVFQHTYVAFPVGFNDLGEGANDALYNLGLQSGLKREGLA